MGEAKLKGNFEERKAQAIAVGRKKIPTGPRHYRQPLIGLHPFAMSLVDAASHNALEGLKEIKDEIKKV